jgi:hypothetical protein
MEFTVMLTKHEVYLINAGHLKVTDIASFREYAKEPMPLTGKPRIDMGEPTEKVTMSITSL